LKTVARIGYVFKRNSADENAEKKWILSSIKIYSIQPDLSICFPILFPKKKDFSNIHKKVPLSLCTLPREIAPKESVFRWHQGTALRIRRMRECGYFAARRWMPIRIKAEPTKSPRLMGSFRIKTPVTIVQRVDRAPKEVNFTTSIFPAA